MSQRAMPVRPPKESVVRLPIVSVAAVATTVPSACFSVAVTVAEKLRPSGLAMSTRMVADFSGRRTSVVSILRLRIETGSVTFSQTSR